MTRSPTWVPGVSPSRQLALGERDLRLLEIGKHLLHQRLLVILLHREVHQALDIGLGIGPGEAELGGCPTRHQSVAPGLGLEHNLLIMRELGFKPVLAVLELAHPCAPLGGTD